MKSLEEFKEYYNESLLPYLTELEEKRKKVVVKATTANILLLIGLVVLYFLFGLLVENYPGIGGFFPMILICYAFMWIAVYVTIKINFVKDFKEQIIRRIIYFINPSLSFEKGNAKNTYKYRQLFDKSGLFRKCDVFRLDDFVSGQIDDVDLTFADVDASVGHGKRSTTLLDGILFIAEFNKDFKGETVIRPDIAEKMLGKFGDLLHSKKNSDKELIKLDDSEFEKNFVVYSTDPDEARYILSQNLMQRILDYKNKMKRDICLSFVSSKIFIAIPKLSSVFEPKIYKTLIDFTNIKEYYENIQFIVDIVDDLKLRESNKDNEPEEAAEL